MPDITLGIIAILAGLVLCFRGFWTLRLVISLWGAFAGFGLGAGLSAAINSESFLASALGWVVGIVLALIFAVLAYLYYWLAVVISLASIGFMLGATVMAALGVSWTWVTILIGVGVGALLALLAIVTDLPLLLLIVLSAMAGASAIVGGIMLLTGALDVADFTSYDVTARMRDDIWWYLLYLALMIAGVVSQSRATAVNRGVRQAWEQPSTPAA